VTDEHATGSSASGEAVAESGKPRETPLECGDAVVEPVGQETHVACRVLPQVLKSRELALDRSEQQLRLCPLFVK
jgi:hypothetical protein